MDNNKKWKCLNCNTEHDFKGHSYKHKYCNNVCQREYQTKVRIKQWLHEGRDWSSGIPAWVKSTYGYLAMERGYKCAVCGITTHNNKPLVLECDHIDGNHKNNVPENLRLICPNCHSQTNTYKGRNRGNGRTLLK